MCVYVCKVQVQQPKTTAPTPPPTKQHTGQYIHQHLIRQFLIGDAQSRPCVAGANQGSLVSARQLVPIKRGETPRNLINPLVSLFYFSYLMPHKLRHTNSAIHDYKQSHTNSAIQVWLYKQLHTNSTIQTWLYKQCKQIVPQKLDCTKSATQIVLYKHGYTSNATQVVFCKYSHKAMLHK